MALLENLTQAVPQKAAVPRHIAIMMGGNGRWVAFSTENWRRPRDEVTYSQRLFMGVLRREIAELHAIRASASVSPAIWSVFSRNL